MPRFELLVESTRSVQRGLGLLAPVVDLIVRLWVATVFFKSGLTKIQSWDTTVALFTNEYHVPLLTPETAALLGTGAELALPVFLALGLGSRLAAFALFVFNVIAVISYPELEAFGIEQHQVWGIFLLVTLLHGPGALSIDHLIARYSGRRRTRRGELATTGRTGPSHSHLSAPASDIARPESV